MQNIKNKGMFRLMASQLKKVSSCKWRCFCKILPHNHELIEHKTLHSTQNLNFLKNMPMPKAVGIFGAPRSDSAPP